MPGSPPARSPRRPARPGKGRPRPCAAGRGGGAQRTTLPGVVGWENERAALIFGGPFGLARARQYRPARSLGTGGAQPGREPERSRRVRPAQADGGRSDDRTRVSARVPDDSPPKQVSAPKEKRSGALARSLAGSEMGSVGDSARAPHFGVGSPIVAIRLTAAPWVKAASLTRVQTLPF